MRSATELQAFLRDIGPRWATDVPGNVRRVIEAYGPLLASAPKESVKETRDIAYGADPRQVLDVFYPAEGTGHAVVLFVHGGAFTDGERNRSSEVYANIMYYLARHGIVGVNMEYRQAPMHKYPAGTEDVAMAYDWIGAHIAKYGGDPARTFLMGHSAGAAHAGTFAYDTRFQTSAEHRPMGFIVVSGRVRADKLPENPNAAKVQAYYGTDAAVLDAVSPVNLVTAESIPTFIAYAEFENPLLDLYCLELAHRIAVLKRRAPPVIRLAGHNHTSIVAHINTSEDLLGSEIVRFIGDHSGFQGLC
ncbi:MAG: hypothetical protein JWR80_6309 [Bradyrhizobium sp.]|nr:hypothetical protein [Bradyrhizobium sp.]